MTRFVVTMALGFVLLGCQRGKEQPLVVAPELVEAEPAEVPADPFGAAGGAYDKLREITEAALSSSWSGQLEDLAPWLEAETVAVEETLALLKAVRVGAGDVYAVANGRIALVYEHIAKTLTKATTVVQASDYEPDWVGQEGRLWERANAFWARCARGCGLAGPYLDAWELRCRRGVQESAAKLAP